MELLKIWEEWARKNGYTSLTQDGIIKTMVTEFCKHLESIPMQLPVGMPSETLSCEQVTELLNYLEERCDLWEKYSKGNSQPIDAYGFCRAELKNVKWVIKELLLASKH